LTNRFVKHTTKSQEDARRTDKTAVRYDAHATYKKCIAYNQPSFFAFNTRLELIS
jgi:hypothetical protein